MMAVSNAGIDVGVLLSAVKILLMRIQISVAK
jgi:hypothetical protein